MLVSAQLAVWVVTCRVVALDKIRRFAVAAGTMGEAYGIVKAALGDEGGRAYHDEWRAWPSRHGLVIEIGSGGDVGVGGIT